MIPHKCLFVEKCCLSFTQEKYLEQNITILEHEMYDKYKPITLIPLPNLIVAFRSFSSLRDS